MRSYILLTSVAFLLFSRATPTCGTVYRLDGSRIPGTEGVVVGAQVDLSGLALVDAQLSNADLRNSMLTGTDLTGAWLNETNLLGADLSGAIIRGASFNALVPGRLLAEQFYQTASYQQGQLQGVQLRYNDLAGWDFQDMDLSDANFEDTFLDQVSFQNAIVAGADFEDSGIVYEQIRQTKSYRDGNLRGINLEDTLMLQADFSDQDLTDADLEQIDLTQADLSRARLDRGNLARSILSSVRFTNASMVDINLSGSRLAAADFRGAVVDRANFAYSDLSATQLASTANASKRDYSAINFSTINLGGYDFTGARLHETVFDASRLNDARFAGSDIKGASFRETHLTAEQLYSTVNYQQSNLSGISFRSADRSGWDLSNQNLNGTNFEDALLTNVVLTNATIEGADFEDTDLTAEQLYSTASYRNGRLGAINLEDNNMSNWNLSGLDMQRADLQGAGFYQASLNRTNLADANLQRTLFNEAELDNANLSNVRLQRATLSHASLRGANLSGATLDAVLGNYADFTNADFSNASLKASLWSSVLRGADFTNTTITNAELSDVTSGGWSEEQLYATRNYQNGSLSSVRLERNDFSGWNFQGIALGRVTASSFREADLRGATIVRGPVGNADFTDAVVDFIQLDFVKDFRSDQFYSTSNYQAKDLQGIMLNTMPLRGWSFRDQDLAGASFQRSDLRDVDFRGAKLMNANLDNAFPLTGAMFDASTFYDQYTRFPDNFDPNEYGLTFVETAVGDFDGDGSFDVDDLDVLYYAVELGRSAYQRIHNSFRLDIDGTVGISSGDVRAWLRDIASAPTGDANLDGVFDSADFAFVFTFGEYEDEVVGNSKWYTGDWNLDGEFGSADLVAAFAAGSYVSKAGNVAVSVPEPSSSGVVCSMSLLLLHRLFRRQSSSDTRGHRRTRGRATPFSCVAPRFRSGIEASLVRTVRVRACSVCGRPNGT